MRDDQGMPLPNNIGTRQELYTNTPELLIRGEWVCLNIEPNVAWPTRPQSLNLNDRIIWIMPLTVEQYPGVAIKRSTDMSREDAELLLYQVLSVISWRESAGISVAYSSGGDLPRMMGLNRSFGSIIRNEFDFTDFALLSDEKARIALALMREARSLNHKGYAFLSYWRILELCYPASALSSWMRQTLDNLQNYRARTVIDGILKQGADDVYNHLYVSSRCAMAHANSTPIINPDNPADVQRLSTELPLVEELAVSAVEECLGIDSPTTQYRKHLYELRGWKDIFGSDFVKRIQEGDTFESHEMVNLPVVNVRLRERPPYLPMEKMQPSMMAVRNHEIDLQYSSADCLFIIRFRLNFKTERLGFDLFNGVYGTDDGSVLAAQYMKEAYKFQRDYLMNGELQMWNDENGILLSRLSAFLPVNHTVNLDGCNAKISAAQAEIERRQSKQDQ